MIPIVIITVISLGGSFFCSLLEACVYSISRTRIESLRKSGAPSGDRLARIRKNIDEAIAAILILNTIANSAGAALAGALVSDVYGDWRLGVLSAVTVYAIFFTVSILFFSEIIPKTLGVKFADTVAPALSLPLMWMIVVLKPAVRACVAVTRLWGQEGHLHLATEEDIINLASLGHRSGQILSEEARWVVNALRLDDVTAHDLMTPNSVVARVPESLRLADTTVDAQHWRFSRIPVCRDDAPDDIIGVVYRSRVFDELAKDHFDLTIGELMDPPDFVGEEVAAHELLRRYLSRRRHLFCVKNERGDFVGVVTLEDVMECLLGEEIVDESDLHEDMQEVARQRRRRLLRQTKEFVESHPEDRRHAPENGAS